jgi:hypothetical protein
MYPLSLDLLGPRTRTGYDTSPTRASTAGSTHKSTRLLALRPLYEKRAILRRCLAQVSNTTRAVYRVFARPPRSWRIKNNRGMAWISRRQDTFCKRAAWLVEKALRGRWRVFGRCCSAVKGGKDRPNLKVVPVTSCTDPALLHISGKPLTRNRVGKHTIRQMSSGPFTISKAAYRRPLCHDKLSPRLAQKLESSCDDRWVQPCRVSTPLAPWSSRFRAWVHGVLLNSTPVIVVRVAAALLLSVRARCIRSCSPDNRTA